MARTSLLILLAILVVAGCRLPPEREALRPLPEHLSFSYADLLLRVRAQASAAVEAFYIDSWQDLADAAAALEQTARFLPKSTEMPVSHKDKIAAEAEQLRQDAVKLGDAARARDVERCNAMLQQMNLLVRQLRPRDMAPPVEPAPPPPRVPDTKPAPPPPPPPAPEESSQPPPAFPGP